LLALIVPGPESDIEDLLFNDLSLVSYDNSTITLQFNFTTPLKISFNDIPDQLVIDLEPGKDLFVDEDDEKILDKNLQMLKPLVR